MESIGGNAIIIKEININFVRKVLKTMGQATKQEIAKETGLSFVTVGTALQYLLCQNEIFETKLAQSKGGRPAQQYSYNLDYAHALVLYIYENKNDIIVHSSVINLAGDSIEENDIKVKNVDLYIFEEIIDSLVKKYPLIKVISFGHHGIEQDGQIIFSDYKMLEGTDFSQHFNSLYGLPVILENDVHAAALGFGKRRHSESDKALVYMHFPDNHQPGAGILINGILLKGKNNFAGEIAGIPLDIEWTSTLYKSKENTYNAIAKLIISICCILNPTTVIINGSSIDKLSISDINQICKKSLPYNILPKMYYSENFMKDYKSGLILKALDELEPNISLTKKRNSFE